MTARRRTVRQRGHRDLLEPRRAALGARPGGALPAAARRRTRRPRPQPPTDDPDYLSTEAARRLAAGDVRFELCIQRYVDEHVDPDRGHRRRVDRAGLARRAGRGADHRRRATSPRPRRWRRPRLIDALAFNPWNTTDEFRPLGNLNRARKAAYDASAAHAAGYRWQTETPCATWSLGAAARAMFAAVNRRVPWHRLPVRLGLLNLEAFRHVLRSAEPDRHRAPGGAAAAAAGAAGRRPARTSGSRARPTARYNDLSAPAMGAVGATFGRNLRPDYRPDLFDEPNPVTVSQQLLHREHVPAGPVAEPAGGRLDPVPGARLGQPRPAPARRRTTSRVPLPAGHDLDEHARTARPST